MEVDSFSTLILGLMLAAIGFSPLLFITAGVLIFEKLLEEPSKRFKPCVFCGTSLKPAAVECHFCGRDVFNFCDGSADGHRKTIRS